LDWIWVLTTVAVGVLAGLVTGFTGASGVMIIVPGLTLLLSIPVHAAIGTSLAVDVVTSLAVAYTYRQSGNIDLKSGLWVIAGAVVGGPLGSCLSTCISEVSLGGLFGILLVLSGVTIWKRGVKGILYMLRERRAPDEVLLRKHKAAALLLGCCIGAFSGVFGAGGGILVLLILVFLLKYDLHKAVGTSTLVMAIIAASAAAGHFMNGNVNLAAFLFAGVSAVGGGRLCATVANRVSEETLGKIIGAIFAFLGVLMTAEYFL